MNGWFNPWWWAGPKGPLSGDVVQEIRPVTSWFSPQIDLNFAGSREIEAEVVSRVASYGKQLGIMGEAMIELADGKQGPALERLRRLMREVEEVKTRQQQDLEQGAKDALERLKKSAPATLERLLQSYRRGDEQGVKRRAEK